MTQPELDSLSNAGNLMVFDNVESAALNTIPCIKMMMSTMTSSSEDAGWYKNLTVFDVLKSGGYKTAWISNQSAVGVYDNVVTCYAKLADTTIFCGSTKRGMAKLDYDEVVLPVIDTLINDYVYSDSRLMFVHLMGSHPSFWLRYPESHMIFKDVDYLQRPSNQRLLLSAYDNSVLYNDKVVSDIISEFDKEEAVIFYFSDHGLDIYESDPTFCGHARYNDPASVAAGNKIPFLIYCTDKYIERYPDNWSRICRASKGTSVYNMEDLMYTIMDICNISFEDQSKNGKSILDRN